MKCKKIITYISPFVDDELPPEARSKVLGHLDKCNNCEKYFSESQVIDNAIKSINTNISLSNDFDYKLKQKIMNLREQETKIAKFLKLFETPIYRKFAYGLTVFIFMLAVFIVFNAVKTNTGQSKDELMANNQSDVNNQSINTNDNISNKVKLASMSDMNPTIASPIPSKVLIEYNPNNFDEAMTMNINGQKYQLDKNNINLVFGKDDIDKVIRYYDPFMKNYIPEIYCSFGLKLIKLGRLDEATDYLNKVIKISPDSIYAKEAEKQLKYIKIKQTLEK